jgi:hypothetical protein
VCTDKVSHCEIQCSYCRGCAYQKCIDINKTTGIKEVYCTVNNQGEATDALDMKIFIHSLPLLIALTLQKKDIFDYRRIADIRSQSTWKITIQYVHRLFTQVCFMESKTSAVSFSFDSFTHSLILHAHPTCVHIIDLLPVQMLFPIPTCVVSRTTCVPHTIEFPLHLCTPSSVLPPFHPS